ncbi:hypothetical protein F5X97DRAFT_312514 [Nemania serpens]|nr:hypothetical protein F5X97DRAFT_312514 [Nemania serpens]
MAQTRAQGAAKRGHNPEDQEQDPPTRKRQRRTAHYSSSKESPIRSNTRHLSPTPSSRPSAADHASSNTAADTGDPNNPIDFWRTEGRWPSQLFEPDMESLLACRRKRTNSASSTTPSDQKPREEKSALYRDPRYETLLATKGSFMVTSKLDITSESKTLCENLLEGRQTPPENSLFRDDLFDSTCRRIHDRNDTFPSIYLSSSWNC